jgi:hypothetical protein
LHEEELAKELSFRWGEKFVVLAVVGKLVVEVTNVVDKQRDR